MNFVITQPYARISLSLFLSLSPRAAIKQQNNLIEKMLSLILTVLMRKYQFFDYVFICQVRDFIISKKRTFGSKKKKKKKKNKKKNLNEKKKVFSCL